MKKIVLFILWFVLYNTTVYCYQLDDCLIVKDDDEVKRIKIGVTAVGLPASPNEIFRKQLDELNDTYGYTTDNEDEINIIKNCINSLKLTEDTYDYELKLLDPITLVSIVDKQGETHILFSVVQTGDILRVTTDEKNYVINNDEWNGFLELVNKLKHSVYFSDICNESDIVKSAITALADAGIVNGIVNTKFAPSSNLRRAEVVIMISKMIEKERGSVRFLDVERSAWYYGAVAECVNCKIVDGYDDNTFRGEETVSELQLVCLAARTLRTEGTAQETNKKYTADTSNIPDWARADVEYAVINGIITEDEAKTLSEKEMTRGEAAVLLYNLYRVI